MTLPRHNPAHHHRDRPSHGFSLRARLLIILAVGALPWLVFAALLAWAGAAS